MLRNAYENLTVKKKLVKSLIFSNFANHDKRKII